MRSSMIAVTTVVMLSFTPAPSNAQIGSGHFNAWDKREGVSNARVRTTRSATRSARRSARHYSSRRATRSVRSGYRSAYVQRYTNSRRSARATRSNYRATRYASGAGIISHPAGCPRRAFCGCGASIEVFGRPIRSLFLAANWLRFPAASPGPGMVAARRGHVMVIRQYLGNNTALVYDANSGGGRTRVHVRSLAGFSVRNPRAGSVKT